MCKRAQVCGTGVSSENIIETKSVCMVEIQIIVLCECINTDTIYTRCFQYTCKRIASAPKHACIMKIYQLFWVRLYGVPKHIDIKVVCIGWARFYLSI